MILPNGLKEYIPDNQWFITPSSYEVIGMKSSITEN